MKKKIQLIHSGISFIDETWGGLYRGGTYLLVGPRKSGKTLIGLQFAKECVNQQEVCLYFTVMKPKDLMINASSIDFDLQHFMKMNQVIVIRVNPPPETEPDIDKYLEGYLLDIVSVVEQYQPSKIIFDELTPFVGYKDIGKLKEIFLQTCEAIEDFGITSLFVLGEPVSADAKNIIDLLIENTTGLIQLKKKQDSEDIPLGGKVTIVPNVGHIEGQFITDYHIEPHRGVVTDLIKSAKQGNQTKAAKGSIYKSLSEIETETFNYSLTNFYNENDFRLILNNQIAYFKSTEQVFTLVSVLLDEKAISLGILTLNQLRNSVRLSADKKDKICILNDRILVLIVKEDQKNVNNFISRIKSNLPAIDDEHLSKIIHYISVYTMQVDESINNADDLLQRVSSDKIQDKDSDH